MIRAIWNMVIKRWQWKRHQRELHAISSLEQFNAFVDKSNDPIFTHYRNSDQASRADFNALVEKLGIELSGKNFLDIGPGYGSALDVARERGAAAVEYVDYSPYVCAFNRLKKFEGFHLDVRWDLDKLPSQRYDLVWVKITFSACRFIRQQRFALTRLFDRYPTIESLLEQVEQLTKSGGTIVFCPYWDSKSGNRLIPDVVNTSLTRKILHRGYQILPFVEKHNCEPSWPITYIRKLPMVVFLMDLVDACNFALPMAEAL